MMYSRKRIEAFGDGWMNKNFCSQCIMYVEEDHPAKMLIEWRESLKIIEEWQKAYNMETTDLCLDEPSYILSHTLHEVHPAVKFIIDAIINIHEEVKKK